MIAWLQLHGPSLLFLAAFLFNAGQAAYYGDRLRRKNREIDDYWMRAAERFEEAGKQFSVSTQVLRSGTDYMRHVRTCSLCFRQGPMTCPVGSGLAFDWGEATRKAGELLEASREGG